MDVIPALLQLPPLKYRPSEMGPRLSYEARRFLPSLAGMLELRPREEASLGNWKDLVQSATHGEASACARSMAVHYDESKVQLQAVTKVSCVLALQIAAENADTYNIPWDAVRPHLPQAGTLRELAKDAGAGLLTEPPGRADPDRNLSFGPQRAPPG